MCFRLNEGTAGMIVLTMVDHEADEFVSLVAYEWTDPAKLKAAWSSVPDGAAPASEAPVAFLADLHTPEGMEDNRYVTTEWIERISGRPLAQMIAEGRAANADQRDMLRYPDQSSC